MRSPDLDADPNAEPYRVLGIDPTGGPDAYLPKAKIKERAKDLTAKHKNDKSNYRAIQLAMKRAKEIHPEQSSNGVWRVPMKLTPESSTVEIQREFEVEVTDFLGNPIEGAQVVLDDGQPMGRTESDGTDRISITNETGDCTVVASKNAEGNKQYVEASETVTVEKQQSRLRFDEVPSDCTAGDEIDVRVVDDEDDPVRGVTVSPEAGTEADTNTDGWASPTVDGSGSTGLSATKSDTTYTQYDGARTSISVKKRRVSLAFDSLPDATKVGKREAVRIVDGAGDPVADVSVSIGSVSESTSGDGRVSIEIPTDAAGETRVTATKGDTPGISFRDATDSVEVERRIVDLSFGAAPDEATVLENTRFRVVDEDGDPVEGVTVAGGSAQDTTGRDGRATLSFEASDLGHVEVTATKGGPRGIEFDSTDERIGVVKRRVSLDLSPAVRATEIDTAVEFTVTGDGGPVSGVTVKHRSMTDTTDGNGTASLTFETGGSKTVVARKDETPTTIFDGDSVNVSVSRIEKRLDLVPPNDKVEVGSPATFTVHDGDGRRVEDAEVDGQNATGEETDRRGEADLTFRSSGKKRVTASKPSTGRYRYVDDDVTIQVRTPPKSVRIADVPDDVSVGDPAEIRVVDHRGNPLPDAVIKAVSNRSKQIDRTNDRGTVEFTFQDPGYYTISATKDGFDVFDQTPLQVDG
jgi:hypothetical protein